MINGDFFSFDPARPFYTRKHDVAYLESLFIFLVDSEGEIKMNKVFTQSARF